MEEKLPGFRFHPTDKESVGFYLTNKSLGRSSLVDGVIGEIDINKHDPHELPRLSRQWVDRTCFFFVEATYTSANKTWRKRVTPSGTWKPSGDDRVINDETGNTIGSRKTLLYRERETSKSKKKKNPGVELKNPNLKVKKNPKVKVKKSDWVMHEYHIRNWSHPNLPQKEYVLCKIKYKGDVISSVGESSHSSINTALLEASPSQAEENLHGLFNPMNEPDMLNNNNLSVQQQPPYIPQDDDDEIGNSVSVQQQASNTVTPTINTQPEVMQQLSDDENGLSMEDLAVPLIEQERAVINTPPHIEQQVDENLDGLQFLLDVLDQQEAPHCLPEVYDENWYGFNLSTPQNDWLNLLIEEEPVDQPLWDFSDQNMFNNLHQQQAPPFSLEDYDEFSDNNNDLNLQPQTLNLPQDTDENTGEELVMQQNFYDYIPKKPSLETIPYYNTDSDDDDAESISVTSSQGTLSLGGDSVGSNSNTHVSSQELIMQQDCNVHRPKKPLSGTIPYYNSDSDDDDDDESISVTSSQGTLSPGGDIVGSNSNTHVSSYRDEETLSSSKDLQISSAESNPEKQEVKTEKKKDLVITEEAMEKTQHKKNPKYVYVDMIVGLILLMVLFGNSKYIDVMDMIISLILLMA